MIDRSLIPTAEEHSDSMVLQSVQPGFEIADICEFKTFAVLFFSFVVNLKIKPYWLPASIILLYVRFLVYWGFPKIPYLQLNAL